MDVRLARPTDAPLVLSLVMDESSHLVRRPSWPATDRVAQSVARALFPLALPGRSWIAREGSSCALVEAQPRRYVIGWDITRLAVRGEADRVLGPALGAVVTHLQSRGVPRLFARCAVEASEVLRTYDFQSMAREYILRSPSQVPGSESELPVDSRYRIPPDAWPLHQLETAVTPPLVRQLEGLTSVDWSKPLKDMSEVVVERDGKLIAWAAWGTRAGPKLINVQLMVHPDYADVGPDLVRHALKQVPAGHRLITRVRDYQVETMRAFIAAGFETVGEEVVMLKHAGVELAREHKRRLQVAAMPSIQGFHSRLHPGTSHRENRVCDGIA
jgi:hypothetical protein